MAHWSPSVAPTFDAVSDLPSDAAPRDLAERFARILREHGPALARLAAGYEADPHEREDLVQETALAVWRALPSFRGECSERTFVFRIAHNRGLAYRWHRRRRFEALDAADAVRDPRPDPASQAVARLDRERLATAVRQLPEAYRAVVMLTLEGLPNRDVAEVLGITENNVAVRLTRARQRLRDLLAESGDEQ